MTLYEINKQIEDLMLRIFSEMDEETGEVPEDLAVELEALNMSRDEKLDNIGVFIKNLEAEAKAIHEEIVNLRGRYQAKLDKIDRLEDYVKKDLLSRDQAKFESPRVAFSFRKSVVVSISDESAIPSDYLKVKEEISVDKVKIKDALKRGETVNGAELIEKQNLQIK